MEDKNELLKTGTCMKEARASPKLDQKLVQHQIDIEDGEIKFKQENYWVSCCLKMDKRAVSYFSQLTICISLCAFTIGMMAVNQDCATFSRYSPLLTLIAGIWMPQPSMKNDNK